MGPGVEDALATCWATRARNEAPLDAARLLARAHRWDPRNQTLLDVGGPVAKTLIADGRAARAAADWETAYGRFAAALTFEPWHAWARRWAEEARDHRLGLTDDVRIGIGGENELRAFEQGVPVEEVE